MICIWNCLIGKQKNAALYEKSEDQHHSSSEKPEYDDEM